jgi:TATA-binding protein-associated factor
MGTGKSIQALLAIALVHFECKDRLTRSAETALVMKQHSQPRSLIVCPSTLVGHWAGEIDKYFPPQTILRSLCLTGSRSERIEKWCRKPDLVNIVITSYAVIRSDIDYLKTEHWCYCVLDEGHLLKNPKTGK